MMTEAAPAVEVRDLGRDGAVRDLLVLTDAERCGRAGLAMPFQNAIVVEVGESGKADVQGRYDVVVIDRKAADARWLEAVVGRAVAVLRPEGRLIVTLDSHRAGAGPVDGGGPVDAVALPGLAWQGLGMLNGRLCAVLVAGGPNVDPVAPGVLLATAETALRLATARTEAPALAAARATAAVAAQLDDRRQSEKALLRHLEALTGELEQERRRHQGFELVRTVVRRSKIAGPVRRIVRPSRRVARKLRKVNLAKRVKRILSRSLDFSGR